ncbi:MAG: hypothetical protein LBT47_06855 [Deltaproteobacteria bacterium]|nr:hypothetical protein [Deltaproteobacteria bacterium]
MNSDDRVKKVFPGRSGRRQLSNPEGNDNIFTVFIKQPPANSVLAAARTEPKDKLPASGWLITRPAALKL